VDGSKPYFLKEKTGVAEQNRNWFNSDEAHLNRTGTGLTQMRLI
jgi:hypothetical protein